MSTHRTSPRFLVALAAACAVVALGYTNTAAAAEPDLAVDNVGANLLANNQFEFRANITNVGNAVASTPWDDRLEVDYQCDGSVDATVDFEHPGGDLSAGETYTLATQYPLTEFGDHCFTVTANPSFGAFSEPNYGNNSDAFLSVSYQDTSAPNPDPTDPPRIISFLADLNNRGDWQQSQMFPNVGDTVRVQWATENADTCIGLTDNNSGNTDRFDTGGSTNGSTTLDPLWGASSGGAIRLRCTNSAGSVTSHHISVYVTPNYPDFESDIYARVNGGPKIYGDGYVQSGDVVSIEWQSDDVVDTNNDFCYTDHDFQHPKRKDTPNFKGSSYATRLGFPGGLPGPLPPQAVYTTDSPNAPYNTTVQFPTPGGSQYKIGCVRFADGSNTDIIGEDFSKINLTLVPDTNDPPTVVLRARSDDNAPDSAADNQNVSASDLIDFQWESENATRCTSSDFPTNSHPNGFAPDVTPPPIGDSKTYTVTCEGPGGTGSDDLTITSVDPSVVDNLTPDITFEHKVDTETTWVDTDTSDTRTILDIEELQLRWSTTNADSCSGTNFSANGQPNGTLTDPGDVTEPAVGNTETYTITCSNSSGNTASESVTVTTDSTIDLSVGSFSVSDQSTWQVTDEDRADGKWTTIDLRMTFTNTGSGVIDAPQDISYAAEFDLDDDGSFGVIGGRGVAKTTQDFGLSSDFAGGATSPSLLLEMNDVEPGTYRIRGRVDLDPDRIDEVDDSLADNSRDTLLTVPIPPPNIIFESDREVVRRGQTVELFYDVDVTYELQCEVTGPNTTTTFNTLSFTSDDVTSGPLDGLTEFLLSCENPNTGDVYERSLTVEVVPSVEEI